MENKDNEFDPTKEAFFSDLGNIENEISNEAYEIVEHALSLIASRDFDDAIELLRQAIGLYSQIDWSNEIEALHKKISEVYLLKEQSFQEIEADTEIGFDIIQEEDISDQEELYKQADELIVQGIEKANQNDFDNALIDYMEAKKLLQKINRVQEVQKINELIENCYNKKADFLQKQKMENLSEEEIKVQKIKEFEEFKRKEEEFSNQAYELFGKATDLIKIHQYDEAIQLYREGITLLAEINWVNEIKRIESSIEQIIKKKEMYQAQIRRAQEEEKKRKQEEIRRYSETQQRVEKEEMTQIEVQVEKIRETYEKKAEEEAFQKEITSIIDQAEKMARDYDINIKKAIKEGKPLRECVYPDIIQMYEDVRSRALSKGWTDQAKIYSQQIIHYKELLNKDDKLRLIEEKKEEKQKVYEEAFKVGSEFESTKTQIDKLKAVEEQKRAEEEIKEIRESMENLAKNAEKLAREYDVKFKKAVRKGELDFESEYPQIIELYSNAKKIALANDWNQEASIYQSHINKILELFEKEKKVRELEAKKAEEKRAFEDTYKIKEKKFDAEQLKKIEIQKQKEIEEANFQQELTDLVNNAEKMAREYEIELKKSLKKGKILEDSPYLEIIQIYSQVKEKVRERGWDEQIRVYTNQINHYREKYDQDQHLREIEAEKVEKRKVFEESQKIKVEPDLDKIKHLESKRLKTIEEEKFQEEINSLINRADKLDREYEVAMKKAIKKGELVEKSPFFEIIEIYTKIRNNVLAKGWTDQALIYSNQIKIYQEKLENDEKLRQIEKQKIQKQKEFEEALKLDQTAINEVKLVKDVELTEEEKFENEMDALVDTLEKQAREYELAIKQGQFDKECPYIEIAEQYKGIREKVYARGWKEEAQIYTNQVQLYQEKYERDQYLRKLETEKERRQIEFEEGLKIKKEDTSLKLEELSKLKESESEEEKLINEAMGLIDEAEKKVRGYELSIKKDILSYSSPYENAIENYERAKKLFQKVGWKEEAGHLIKTIKFYKEKKVNDDLLRERELEKIEMTKKKPEITEYLPKEDVLAQELRIQAFERKKEEKSSEAEPIFEIINQAENLAQDYERRKKEGILNVESPFLEIINLYTNAKKMFEKIQWQEQANQINSSIQYYQRQYEADEKVRTLELNRLAKFEEEKQKREIELRLAKKAEEELVKQKALALEQKKKKVLEYEMKKEQAFKIMDLAKKELNQNNFEKAINLYNDTLKIFDDIDWFEGTKMVQESIKVIRLKKEKLEKEKHVAEIKREEEALIEAQLEEKVKMAKEIQERQREQQKQEILLLEKEKEREKEISVQAYELLEEGTQLKDKKKFEEAYEKYILARNLFKKIDWAHEVSRINNDLLFILKKEMKQTEKIKTMQEKKVEEKRELELLLKEAEQTQLERERIRKEEKQKQREKLIQEEIDSANIVIRDLKYNEGILMIMQQIGKLNEAKNEKLIKQLHNQAEIYANASQVPIITLDEIDPDENISKFRAGFQALDKAQISLSNDNFRRAISELNEAIFNLQHTKMGRIHLSKIEEKINSLKKQLGIEITKVVQEELPKPPKEDIRAEIAKRRAERRRKIQETLKK